ncbi:PAS domain-containing protein [Sphingomonas gei]|uniref:histidine kinase n=2 Tax=Sphingomonas gei TaxID=1395960 RepID=A0A4S1XI02_9SPHN|nr:PAS domain-containing protein [Sphingomonas gei]
MIGARAISYWPREGHAPLAELIVAAVTDSISRDAKTRTITSLAFVDPALSVSAVAHDIVFVALSGTPVDQRSLWGVRASEERYRNLIHHLPIALLQVDSTPITAIFDNIRLEGVTDIARYLAETPELVAHASRVVQITDVNRNAIQLLGADCSTQCIGPIGFLFSASPETARRVIAAHFKGRRSHAERTRLQTFDGRLRDVELTVTYPTPPERLDVTLISLEDVTDRVRTETQLRQLQGEYSRAARISMLGELATSIAHEVNQPLAAIVTNAETSLRWLARPEPNLAKVEQLTVRVVESARVASEIVQRIRGMASQGAPERVLLDLGAIVEEALLFVRHEIETSSIGLSVVTEEHLPRVLGDRVQLQQVIVNLLLNAVQALAHGAASHGSIEIATAIDADAVVVTIRDDGPGIDPENLDRIFGSFFTTKDDGIGVGLAICQSIIAGHGGAITAANRATGGAAFRVSLPVARSAALPIVPAR